MSDTTEPSSSPATPATAGAAPVPAPPAQPTVPPTPRLVTVNSVNWGNILDFTQLFRGFRLAINPAKLGLALLAILLIYVGGRAFDFVWGPQASRDAIQKYAARSGDAVSPISWQAQRESALGVLLGDDDSIGSDERATLQAAPKAAHKRLKQYYVGQFNKAVEASGEARKAASGVLDGRSPADIENQRNAMAARVLMDRMTKLNDTVGYGVFDTFLRYETSQFEGLVGNTLSGNLIASDPGRLGRSDSAAGCIANMVITGPRWLFATGPMQHRSDGADTWGGWLGMLGFRGLYLGSLVVLAVFSLVVMAFTGAAISRLSALELAGIERAPLHDVFMFAARRLWVFIKAPVSPFIILLAIGLVMALGGMFGAIPYIGPVIIGIGLFIFLGIAFVLMLLSLGILGGFNLLYPTIAVEGADAFDAMSRSFAYAYSRPWRLVFYTITSLVYGVLTFLFVSFAIYLILLLTHTFVGWGMDLLGTHYGAQSGQLALETMWPVPQFMQLVRPVNWYVMSWPEFIGSIFLYFWVFLLITGIGAYVISYYFSSHTIIYLLLRRSVDGQNLREVYLDEKAK